MRNTIHRKIEISIWRCKSTRHLPCPTPPPSPHARWNICETEHSLLSLWFLCFFVFITIYITTIFYSIYIIYNTHAHKHTHTTHTQLGTPMLHHIHVSLARQCSSPVRAENSLSRVGTCSQHGRIAIGIAIGNHESQHGRITMSFRSSSLLNFIDFTDRGGSDFEQNGGGNREPNIYVYIYIYIYLYII